MSILLEIQNISVRFGGVQALAEVSFDIKQGELLCLIGPNGAGKTTLLKTIIGVVSAPSARIRLDGRNITRLPTYKRARLGLAMTHQIVRPFHSMSVLDNVTLAAGHARIRNVLRSMTAINRRREQEAALALLGAVGIADVAHSSVLGQPLGILKRVEMARALALKPKLLLLDEPLAGLNSVEAARLADLVSQLNEKGTTIVMIEHNLGEVMRISRRLVVLDNGRKIAEGLPETVMRDSTVRAAYVGKERTDVAA